MSYAGAFDFLWARPATFTLGVGNHIEFGAVGLTPTVRGTSIVVTTGVGQAAGLFTLAPDLTYQIEFRIDIGAAAASSGNMGVLFTDNAGVALLMDDGGNLITFTVTNANNNTASTRSQGMGYFTTGVVAQGAEFRINSQGGTIANINPSSFVRISVVDLPGTS